MILFWSVIIYLNTYCLQGFLLELIDCYLKIIKNLFIVYTLVICNYYHYCISKLIFLIPFFFIYTEILSSFSYLMQSKCSLKIFAPVHLRTKYELCVPLVNSILCLFLWVLINIMSVTFLLSESKLQKCRIDKMRI